MQDKYIISSYEKWSVFLNHNQRVFISLINYLSLFTVPENDAQTCAFSLFQ